jgi:membrane-bound inhibitor of C-type lysozyme
MLLMQQRNVASYLSMLGNIPRRRVFIRTSSLLPLSPWQIMQLTANKNLAIFCTGASFRRGGQCVRRIKLSMKGSFVMKLVLAWFALLITVNSATAAEATYRCADGTRVRASFSDLGQTGSARLNFVGQRRPIILPQVPSADGGRYADINIEFWIKGRTARLTRAGATTECKTR